MRVVSALLASLVVSLAAGQAGAKSTVLLATVGAGVEASAGRIPVMVHVGATTTADSEALARSVDDTGGVYLVPAFVGLGAPYWDERARGVLVGITRGTTREHLVRATLESIAYQTRDVVECLEQDSGLALEALQVDGGACENDFLMQFQADVLGAPVVRPPVLEVTALGAAMLAGLGVGFWGDRADVAGRTAESSQVFEPRSCGRERARLY